MAKEPEDRFATAGDFCLAYGRALQFIPSEAREADYWLEKTAALG